MTIETILVSSFSTRYKADIVKSSLLGAFKNTEDVPSFVWILHYLYVNEISFQTRNLENNDVRKNSQAFVDSFILETVDHILAKNEKLFTRTTNNKYLIMAVITLSKIKPFKYFHSNDKKKKIISFLGI